MPITSSIAVLVALRQATASWVIPLALVILVGCQPAAPKSAEDLPWAEQITLVQSGESDEIALRQRSATPAELSALNELTGLRRLRLERTPVDDAGAERLAKLEHLEFLNLPRSEISDRGLSHLASLPRLRLLRIGSPRISDAGIAALATCKSLRFVHLIEMPITDAALDTFAGMPWLESLYLDGTQVTETGLAALLKANPGLHLHINDSHLADDPQAHPH